MESPAIILTMGLKHLPHFCHGRSNRGYSRNEISDEYIRHVKRYARNTYTREQLRPDQDIHVKDMRYLDKPSEWRPSPCCGRNPEVVQANMDELEQPGQEHNKHRLRRDIFEMAEAAVRGECIILLCNSGKHRSVMIGEGLAQWLTSRSVPLTDCIHHHWERWGGCGNNRCCWCGVASYSTQADREAFKDAFPPSLWPTGLTGATQTLTGSARLKTSEGEHAAQKSGQRREVSGHGSSFRVEDRVDGTGQRANPDESAEPTDATLRKIGGPQAWTPTADERAKGGWTGDAKMWYRNLVRQIERAAPGEHTCRNCGHNATSRRTRAECGANLTRKRQCTRTQFPICTEYKYTERRSDGYITIGTGKAQREFRDSGQQGLILKETAVCRYGCCSHQWKTCHKWAQTGRCGRQVPEGLYCIHRHTSGGTTEWNHCFASHLTPYRAEDAQQWSGPEAVVADTRWWQ